MKHKSRLVEKVKQLLKRKWGTQLRYILTFCIILFCINLSFIPSYVSNAQELPISGIGGDHITWTYDVETKTLTFTGYGKMQSNGGQDYQHASVQNCGDWDVLRDEVEKVVFGEGITEIGYKAFYGFCNIKEIAFSSTIKKICSYAFAGCGVEELVIPSMIKEVGFNAFSGEKVKNIVIEEGVEKFWRGALCLNAIEELTLPKSMKGGTSPVGHCSQLKTLNLPSNMKVIEGQWFADCPNLKQVTLPNSLKRIGSEVFNDSSLESITIPKNVEILGKKGTDSSMFYMCKNLKQLVVKSKKIKKVYSSVFKYFPKKATIYVPNSKKKEYTKMFRKAKLPKKVKIKAIKDMKK